jgi:hypothetical protein
MKGRIFSVLLVFMLLFQKLNATPQDWDMIIFKGDTFYYANFSGMVCLLETYYIEYQNYEYPFKVDYCWSSNVRGHISTWEIKNDSLFLIEVKICSLQGYEEISLKEYYGSKVKNKKVFADWFSGYIDLMHLKPDDRNYNREIDFHIISKFDKGKLFFDKKINNSIPCYYPDDTIKFSENLDEQLCIDYSNYLRMIQNMGFLTGFDTLNLNELKNHKHFDRNECQIICPNDSIVSSFKNFWLTNRYCIIDSFYKNKDEKWSFVFYTRPLDKEIDKNSLRSYFIYGIKNIYESLAHEFRCELNWIMIKNEKQ